MRQPGAVGPCSTVICGRRRATIGALVTCGGQPHALTVSHVFCMGRRRRVEFPGVAGGGRFISYVPLRRFGIHRSDAALIALDEKVPLVTDHPVVGRISGDMEAVPSGLPVSFKGSSGISRGHVVHASCTIRVRYSWGSRRLSEQILIKMDDGSGPRNGDSGSLWVSDDGLAVGLQVAMVKGLAVVSAISPLLRVWRAQLLHSGGVQASVGFCAAPDGLE